MSLHGVWIDGKNTLDDGLVLLAEMTISEPEPRTNYITVPEADGDLDFTGALTDGVVRYGMREISFSLFPLMPGTRRAASEEYAALIRQKFTEQVHGQRVKLWLPDDTRHYFIGRMTVGNKGGYNNVTIPVKMTAEPWRYKNLETKIRITAAGVYNLQNETRRVVPVFSSTSPGARIALRGVSHTMESGDNQWDDIVLQPGHNTINVTNYASPINITYQEAVL